VQLLIQTHTLIDDMGLSRFQKDVERKRVLSFLLQI
jgi:hypothetical protein